MRAISQTANFQVDHVPDVGDVRFYWRLFGGENALASATFATSAHLISGDKL